MCAFFTVTQLTQLMQQKQDRDGETNRITQWLYSGHLEPIRQDRLPSLLERTNLT